LTDGYCLPDFADFLNKLPLKGVEHHTVKIRKVDVKLIGEPRINVI
jgi:hypothetical protein